MSSIPGSGSSPGEGNGIHSSIPAWRIPWTEEPGGLQSMGAARVEQDSATKPPLDEETNYNVFFSCFVPLEK